MQKKRNELIEKLIARDPTFRPPADYRPEKKWVKLRIPTKEYPGHNFIGMIIGPRGATQQRMQAETNTKIAIR
jgi:splicing factor 1